MKKKVNRPTPRQDSLCAIMASFPNGRAPSKSAAYMQMTYGGGYKSNYYGSRVMERARRAGLIREVEKKGSSIVVELTDAGWDRADRWNTP